MSPEGLHPSRTSIRPGYGRVACVHRAQAPRHRTTKPPAGGDWAHIAALGGARGHGREPSILNAGLDRTYRRVKVMAARHGTCVATLFNSLGPDSMAASHW